MSKINFTYGVIFWSDQSIPIINTIVSIVTRILQKTRKKIADCSSLGWEIPNGRMFNEHKSIDCACHQRQKLFAIAPKIQSVYN